MARRNESILELLSQCPWWVSVIASATAFIGLKFIVPAVDVQNPFFKGLAGAAPSIAPMAFLLLLPAPVSFLNSRRKRKLLDKQKDLDSIRSLPWKQFEELVAEAYRRKGYGVVENHGVGPDGGIDLVLKQNGNRFLVQCKQWKRQKVDVRVVREMYGVMTAESATGVIIMTSGLFTQEAKSFAENKPIDLVEGHQLAELVQGVQAKPSFSANEIDSRQESEPTCEKCGAKLVLRVARRGNNPGSKF
ncbi:MAG: restriction endonuclease, partial [Nitrospirota bacterium]